MRETTESRSSFAPGGAPPGCRSITFSVVIGGSMVLSAASIQVRTRARAASSRGISASERAPRCMMIAHDSNSTRPSSSIAGTWPKGCIARYCGDFWSSGPISTTS